MREHECIKKNNNNGITTRDVAKVGVRDPPPPPPPVRILSVKLRYCRENEKKGERKESKRREERKKEKKEKEERKEKKEKKKRRKGKRRKKRREKGNKRNGGEREERETGIRAGCSRRERELLGEVTTSRG